MRLIHWAVDLGQVITFGVEGTGSYGQAPMMFLQQHGGQVIEANRPDRPARRAKGTSTPSTRRTPPGLYRIILSRMHYQQDALAFVDRRTADGKTKGDHPMSEAVPRPRGLPDPTIGVTAHMAKALTFIEASI